MSVAELVRRLIAAGTPADVAAEVVAEAFAAGASGNSTGIPVDSAAEKRRAWDRNRKRNSTGKQANSGGIPPETESASLSLKEEDKKEDKKKRESRATQLPDGWRPDPDPWQSAVDRLGSAARAEQELLKFKNHALDKGRTSKRWGAAWANWVERAVVYAGGTNANGTSQNRTYSPAGPAPTRDTAVIAGMGRALERRRAARAAAGTGPVDVPGCSGSTSGVDADRRTAHGDGGPHRQLALLPGPDTGNKH